MDKCKETGKQSHSEGTARAHLHHLQQKMNYVGHIYHCEFCGFWHVGREKKQAHKNKYKK